MSKDFYIAYLDLKRFQLLHGGTLLLQDLSILCICFIVGLFIVCLARRQARFSQTVSISPGTPSSLIWLPLSILDLLADCDIVSATVSPIALPVLDVISSRRLPHLVAALLPARRQPWPHCKYSVLEASFSLKHQAPC